MKPEFLPHSILALDIQRYSDRSRIGQLKLREDLRELVHNAASKVNVNIAEWKRQDSGDGELALIPPDIPKVTLADDLVRELGVALRYLNTGRKAVEERLRLRAALHHGDVHVDGTGYVGDPVVETSRLLDADLLRRALDAVPGTDIAVILSEQMMRAVEDLGAIYRHNFQNVPVAVKDFRAAGWLTVPGFPPPYVPAAAGTDDVPADQDGKEAGGGAKPPASSKQVRFRDTSIERSPMSFGNRGQAAGRDIHNG